MKKILSIVGARPNFVKIAALYPAFRAYPEIIFKIVHTGQHYDPLLSDVFFRGLGLPTPDYNLGIGSATPITQLAAILSALETVLQVEKPELVLVVGDTNSTLAGALAAAKTGIPIAHVEAGLRSGDRTMPEELNRIVVDGLSDYAFVTEQSGLDHLEREGHPTNRVFFVGNCMIDVLMRYRSQAPAHVPEQLQLLPRTYCLFTLHRPSNVDTPAGLERIVQLIEAAVIQAPVVFPLHPRTRINLEKYGFRKRLDGLSNLYLTEPQGYTTFLYLLEHATLVITDSGGVQEETTFLQVPCLTFRRNTERPVTVTVGTNELLSTLDPMEAADKLQIALQGKWKTGQIPPLWDGQAGTRIAEILVRHSDFF